MVGWLFFYCCSLVLKIERWHLNSHQDNRPDAIRVAVREEEEEDDDEEEKFQVKIIEIEGD